MLLDGPQDEMNLELVALCINLAINKRNAQIMVEENRLRRLMARAFRNQDSLIMKMIRNIAMHEGTKQNFIVSCIFHNMLLFKNVHLGVRLQTSGLGCFDFGDEGQCLEGTTTFCH